MPRGDRIRNLDFLFGALKVAPDEDTAKAIEERIWALWTASGSDTANLLMTRVKTAIEAKDLDLAIKLLDAIVKIRPDYIEAWNRRATVYYMKKDYRPRARRYPAGARARAAPFRRAGRARPDHAGYSATTSSALEVYRRALAIHPRLERMPDLVKTLTEKVEGRDI